MPKMAELLDLGVVEQKLLDINIEPCQPGIYKHIVYNRKGETSHTQHLFRLDCVFDKCNSAVK